MARTSDSGPAGGRPPIAAAGAVLWRPSRKHGVRVALVHRPRYRDWSLPKGKADGSESALATAYREVFEETGFRATLGRALTSVEYLVSQRRKVVRYFSARATEGGFVPNREVDRLVWLPVAEAKERTTYEFDRVVLDTFGVHEAELATVVLVRHAKAGVRESYPGPDSERPLDTKGQNQARALATELAVFGPRAVHSAAIERCRQTVAPLARQVGLPVQLEESLTEEAYRLDPAGARRRVMALAERGSAVAVCSQGGVIPGVVRSLAGRADLSVGSTTTPKGSFWVLSFDGDRLVQADRHPAP